MTVKNDFIERVVDPDSSIEMRLLFPSALAERLHKLHLFTAFEEAAFEALSILKERIEFAEDPSNVEPEDFELPQLESTGLGTHYFIDYKPTTGLYVVQEDYF